MSKIEWNDAYATGLSEIDSQHQKLVAIYNDLDDAMSVGRGQKEMADILERLIDYTVEHFRFEEGMMEQAGYPELEYHRREHAQLVDKVTRFRGKLDLGQERISKPVMKFLNFWLVNHIQQSDKDFGRFVHEAEPAAVNAD